MNDRSQLITEQRNSCTLDIDRKSTLEIVNIINTEDSNVINAVRSERLNISKTVDLIVNSFKKGSTGYF